MGWSPEEQALFVGYNLGPTMANKGFGDIKIMVVDDQRTFFPTWPSTVVSISSSRLLSVITSESL